MSISDLIKREAPAQSFKRAEQLKLTPGTHVIRLLDKEPFVTRIHYVNNTTFECLGDDCPICRNNKIIMTENPKNYREMRGYNADSLRLVANVLDRTPVKICPKCGVENKPTIMGYSPSCSGCGTMIMAVSPIPLNKAKVLNSGVRVWNSIGVLEKGIMDVKGNPIDITSYDLMLMCDKNKKNQVDVTVVPQTQQNDVVEVPQESLSDCSKVILHLSVDEIETLLKGVNVADILRARGKSVAQDVPQNEVSNEIKSSLEEMFNLGA